MTDRKADQFGAYALSDEILEALRLLGYETPTKIQKAVIPVLLSQQNVMVKAPTGSGKTAAFGIPVCEAVDWAENLPQALILEPTRELAVQVREEVFLIGRKKRIKAVAVFGGLPIDKQILTLKQKSHIVVGTPGRVMDLIRRAALKPEVLKWLILDEADLMLDMGFIDEIRELLKLLPAECNLSLFSATLKPEIRALVQDCIKADTAELITQEQSCGPTGTMIQKLYQTDQEQKYQTFLNVLFQENPESCIIFCGTREMTNVLFQKMRRNRIFCGMLHGEIDQQERLKTIEAFRRGRFRFLIATDVAARGIDLDGISLVINYDFPGGRETYVHRIGRTGRNGRSGIAVSLVCEQDRRMLQMIEAYTGFELVLQQVPESTRVQEQAFWKKQREKADLKPEKGRCLSQGITCLAVGGGRKSKMRAGDLVGAICGIDGMTVDDIGIIDIRDSISYVEILNQKGCQVLESLQNRPIKGRIRKVRITKKSI